MNHDLKVNITLAGNGTRAQVAKSLREIAETIEHLTDEEIQQGGDLEDDALAGPYDECND